MDRRAQVFGLKECQFAFTERRTYDRYIYEKSTVQLASVGLAQARPNKFLPKKPCYSIQAKSTVICVVKIFLSTEKYFTNPVQTDLY